MRVRYLSRAALARCRHVIAMRSQFRSSTMVANRDPLAKCCPSSLFMTACQVFNVVSRYTVFFFTSQSGITNQSGRLVFCSSNKFKVRIHVINTSAAFEQNQLLNAGLELEKVFQPPL